MPHTEHLIYFHSNIDRNSKQIHITVSSINNTEPQSNFDTKKKNICDYSQERNFCRLCHSALVGGPIILFRYYGLVCSAIYSTKNREQNITKKRHCSRMEQNRTST